MISACKNVFWREQLCVGLFLLAPWLSVFEILDISVPHLVATKTQDQISSIFPYKFSIQFEFQIIFCHQTVKPKFSEINRH